MISTIQNLHIGNALRLFIQPPAGAVAWRVLRKGGDTFTGATDPDALVAYEGNDRSFLDVENVPNEIAQFYKPYYTTDFTTWSAGATATGTATPDYEDATTDVLSLVRDRLEAGLLIECQRENFLVETGSISVFTAPPSLERDIRWPLVTVHLDREDPGERGIGEMVGPDYQYGIGDEWNETEGWIANTNLAIIGWCLNSDERIELRKALRRVLIGNLPVFSAAGLDQVSFDMSDIDAINGEYPAQVYQVMCNFTCVSPVAVGGKVDPVRTIITRNVNG